MIGKRFLSAPLAVLLAFSSAGGAAQTPTDEGRPEAFRKLIDCRSVVGDAARLACLDSQVAAIDQAERSGELVIADKAQVRKAQRSLFGFSLPKTALFGRGSEEKSGEEEGFDRIESTIKSARQMSDGRWSIVIEDGARWVQTDSKQMGSPAKAGDKIAIRRAALGSFFANVNNQIAIRVRRQN